MSTNSLLTRPQATCGTLLTNENEHLTHTLQARCGTFTLLPCSKSKKNAAEKTNIF